MFDDLFGRLRLKELQSLICEHYLQNFGSSICPQRYLGQEGFILRSQLAAFERVYPNYYTRAMSDAGDDMFDLEGYPSGDADKSNVSGLTETHSSTTLDDCVNARSGDEQGSLHKNGTPGEHANAQSEVRLEDHVIMGSSVPISIPAIFKRKDPSNDVMKDMPATFIPPHKLSARDPSLLMEGSAPNLGTSSRLRARNKVLRSTGFLPKDTSEGFLVSRLSSAGMVPRAQDIATMAVSGEHYLQSTVELALGRSGRLDKHASLDCSIGGLAAALSPVVEGQPLR